MTKNVVMFPHGGSGNHGCEAIVRTTVNMFSDYNVQLFTDKENEDRLYLGEDFCSLVNPRKAVTRLSLEYISAFIKNHLFRQADSFDVLSFSPVISACGKNDVLLSIGGDNYCYGDNQYIYLVNRCVRKRGAKTVLWGCSVEPDDISEPMRKDLMEYDLIVARESLTYEALKAINPNTVLCADPAFTLPVSHGKMPNGLGEKPFIGVNVSPLIQSCEQIDGITFANYRSLLKNILEETNNDIALIPHVVWDFNDDRVPLRKLYEEFSDSGRVFMVEDQNCTQLKDVISQCRMFVGARTHATIAAYSTCVPTLVVGYSVKARGIAKDLFGADERYVLPVQSLQHEDDLTNAFRWIFERETEVRKKLSAEMPEYIESARKAKECLERMF